MEWVKLYTTFHDHRKTVELDANAIALWTLCLSWSGAQETDGFVPRRIALRFLAGELGDEAAGRLVRVGLWESIEGGYRMANWGERQTTVAERDARRAQWRDRKARQGARPEGGVEDVNVPDHAGFTRESRVLPATREEERREDQSDSPPPPSRGVGTDRSGPVPSRSGQRSAVEASPDAEVVAAYSRAFTTSHAGRSPAVSLVSGIAHEARRLRAEGQPPGDLIAAVRRCAELSRGPSLLSVALAEVQAGAPRQRDRPGRSDLMDRWERVHFGART